jgi:signal transduction histidine kinase
MQGNGTSVYRGDDRRGLITAERIAPGRGFIIAGVVLLGVVGLLFVVTPAPVEVRNIALIAAQLDAAALMLALLLAALCLARWRLIGEAAVLWLAGAVTVYAVSVLGAGYILTSNLRVNDATIVPLLVVGTIVAVTASGAAVVWYEVDTGLTPSRVMLRLIALVAIVELLVAVLPSMLTALPIAGSIAWTLLAVYAMWRGLRRHRPLLAWGGLLFFALAFAELFANIAVAHGPIAEVAPSLLRATGFLCALVGGAADLARIYVKQGARLLESKTSVLTAEARMQAGLAEQAEKAHEAANALAAIEAATLTLQRYRDQLGTDDREELSLAVSAEVHRLQRLVAARPEPASGPGRFRVTEALAALVTCARSQGASVHLDVPDHLVALGNPAETAQVLQNLFQNAHRYAGGEISVRATLEGDEVVVRVEDDGPGIPEHERDLIFERGVRGTTSEATAGSGLGLYVSARLMRDQGGELRLEDRPDGGACFAVALPGFTERPEQPMEDLAEERQFAPSGQLHLVPFRLANRSPGLVEEHQRLGGEVVG